MSLDCLSVGILVADHLCAPIPHLPKAGELVLTDQLVLNIGGCAANVAVDMARLGLHVGVIGCVGEDAFGRFVCETLESHGISTAGVRRLPEVGTSGTLIVNVQGEDRRFIHTVGANAAFTAADIDPNLVRQAKVLYVGGYFLMDALTAEALAEVFRQARADGVQTVLDVVIPGPGDYWTPLKTLLPQTDFFLPNQDEGEVITSLADATQQAEKFHAAGAGAVVITCGEDGAVYLSADTRLRAGTFPVNFVDGSGAGDAFDAGFIYGLLAGESPQRCLEWGSALGASCVQAIGTTAGVFDRPQAEAFLKEHALAVSAF